MRGMSVVAAARIVSEIGSIDQFDSALKLQSCAGSCPDMTKSGGKSHSKGLTKVRNEYLSNAVHPSTDFLYLAIDLRLSISLEGRYTSHNSTRWRDPTSL